MAKKSKGSNITLSPRALRNAKWITQNIVVPEGRLVGSPVELSPAQLEWLEMIYGSKTRTFILSMPRKNGKTAFSAMIVLLHLVGPEAVPNGQLYSTANSKDQASVLFNLAARMVRLSPSLYEFVGIRDTNKHLYCTELGTVYKALSADVSTAMGLSPTLHISDESGQVRGARNDLFEALETASAAQLNPLTIVISTQAAKAEDFLSVMIDDGLAGADSTVKCKLYQVPVDADVFDLEVVAQAQPNWHLMNHDEVAKMARDAQRMPSKEAGYRNLVCNQRIEATNPFISKSVWIANGSDVDDEAFYNNPVYIGLDLSAKTDLTAMVCMAYSDKWHVKAYFWTPSNGLRDRAQRDRTPYDVWADNGLIRVIDGSSLDYEVLAKDIAEIVQDYDVQSLAFDRWRIDLLKKEFSEIGIELPMKEFGQGFKDMSPALEKLEGMLLNNQLAHGNNPVLTMCMANTKVTQDPAGNKKLDKQKSTGRIDGAVALAMACGILNNEAENTKSFWETLETT